MVNNHLTSSIIVRLAVIMTLVIAAFTTPNITYANKPGVVSVILDFFNPSTKLIRSNRAEELSISLYANGTSNLTFNIYRPTKT